MGDTSMHQTFSSDSCSRQALEPEERAVAKVANEILVSVQFGQSWDVWLAKIYHY